MTSLPTFPPLVGVSQETEGLLKIVALDPGTRVNPGVGVREATQHGHQAPVPEDTGWGVLSASDVTSGCLETTTEAFEVISGTRQPRLLHVRKQMGSTRDRDLLHVGHDTAQCCRKTAVVTLLKKSQELGLSVFTAGLDMYARGDLVHPAEAHHSRRGCLVE